MSANKITEPHVTDVYTDHFYAKHIERSLASAALVLSHLFYFLEPKSVVDVGCGRGTWLHVCRKLGASVLVGYDGHWNSQEQMIDQGIVFHPIDLAGGFRIEQKFDLAMSLEVAEHLPSEAATAFISAMTETSDVLLFGAAIPGQQGNHHVNEQFPSYWASMLIRRGFAVFDLIRPKFWGDKRVAWWYSQNTFLYVRKTSPSYRLFSDKGAQEIEDVSFMDCVHPILFQRPVGFTLTLQNLLPSLLRAIERRLRS